MSVLAFWRRKNVCHCCCCVSICARVCVYTCVYKPFHYSDYHTKSLGSHTPAQFLILPHMNAQIKMLSFFYHIPLNLIYFAFCSASTIPYAYLVGNYSARHFFYLCHTHTFYAISVSVVCVCVTIADGSINSQCHLFKRICYGRV